jgi:hypothetical protein
MGGATGGAAGGAGGQPDPTDSFDGNAVAVKAAASVPKPSATAWRSFSFPSLISVWIDFKF